MKISKWERFILYPLAAVLLTIFAFYDLPIMQTLFDTHNVFGRMGELGGEIPLQLLGVVVAFGFSVFAIPPANPAPFGGACSLS
jgi:hypothetical protein